MKNRIFIMALALSLCLGMVPAAAAATGQEPEATASGTLKFYIGDTSVCPGDPVSELLALKVYADTDWDALLSPRHMSGYIRLRIEDEALDVPQRPCLFLTVWNPTDADLPLREAVIYSITINTDSGMRFGTDQQQTPFVTGQTTLEELMAAYGIPDYEYSRRYQYREIAYYEPFSGAYFSFAGGKVRQVSAYYSADRHAPLAERLDTSLFSTYFGLDACILMNQYLDTEPYLLAENPKTAQTSRSQASKEGEAALLVPDIPRTKQLSTRITLDGAELSLGVLVENMPEPYRTSLSGLTIPLPRNCYYRIGRIQDEEFFLLNYGRPDGLSNGLVVKGIITQNPNYTSWGKDHSSFHTFSYMGLTNDSTIDDIVARLGVPQELHFTSSPRACFVWMHYADEEGNTLRIQVDPLTNQITELRVEKYFKNAWMYS